MSTLGCDGCVITELRKELRDTTIATNYLSHDAPNQLSLSQHLFLTFNLQFLKQIRRVLRKARPVGLFTQDRQTFPRDCER